MAERSRNTKGMAKPTRGVRVANSQNPPSAKGITIGHQEIIRQIAQKTAQRNLLDNSAADTQRRYRDLAVASQTHG